MKITLKQFGTGAGATVGVLASLVGVLSYVDQKREDPPPAQVKSLAEIQDIELHDTGELLSEFLRKTPNSKGRSYTTADLRRRGYSFLLEVRSQAPVGTRLRLRWRLRYEGGDAVAGADYDQVASDFTSSALDQSEEVPVWVPDPVEPGRYVVRFTFQRLDRAGREVGFAREKDSDPFEHVVP